MHTIAVALACLACAGHGRRAKSPLDELQSSAVAENKWLTDRSNWREDARGTDSLLNALALLLLAHNAPTAATLPISGAYTSLGKPDVAGSYHRGFGRHTPGSLARMMKLRGGATGTLATHDQNLLQRVYGAIFPGNPTRERAAMPAPAPAPSKAADTEGTGLNRGSNKAKKSGRSAPGSVISVHSKKEFDSLLAASSSKQLVVVDFFATWCGPCKEIAPKYAAMAAAFPHVKFVKVDVDECKDLSQQYGVQSMPTFKLLRARKVIDEMKGADEGTLREKVAALAGKADRWASVGSGRTL